MPTTNLEKIYISPYRSFNFKQLFFYDIFYEQRLNTYFTSYWSSNYKSIRQSVVTQPLSASTWGQLKYLPYSFPYISTLVYWYTFKNSYIFMLAFYCFFFHFETFYSWNNQFLIVYINLIVKMYNILVLKAKACPMSFHLEQHFCFI